MVALTADSSDALLQQICQDFDCGDIYYAKTYDSPPGVVCFHGCVHKDGHLRNCSRSQSSNCLVVTKVECGKDLMATHKKSSLNPKRVTHFILKPLQTEVFHPINSVICHLMWTKKYNIVWEHKRSLNKDKIANLMSSFRQ